MFNVARWPRDPVLCSAWRLFTRFRALTKLSSVQVFKQCVLIGLGYAYIDEMAICYLTGRFFEAILFGVADMCCFYRCNKVLVYFQGRLETQEHYGCTED